MTPEGKIQAKLIKQLETDGWYVIKLMRNNKNGIPDLLCMRTIKHSRATDRARDYVSYSTELKFIEVKAPNGKLSKIQEYRINELRDHGFTVEVHHPETH